MQQIDYQSSEEAVERRLLAHQVEEFRRSVARLWGVAALALALSVVALSCVLMVAGALFR